LSLHHGDTKIAQLKVEEWLATVPSLDPDLSSSTEQFDGTSKAEQFPKQRDPYGKVLELYCLSLLPANEEWEYAATFIDMNEYISPNKKQVPVSCQWFNADIP
jgi:hypothetical protein